MVVKKEVKNMNHINFNIVDNITDSVISNNIKVTLHKEIKNSAGNEFSRSHGFLKLYVLKENNNTALDYEYLGG